MWLGLHQQQQQQAADPFSYSSSYEEVLKKKSKLLACWASSQSRPVKLWENKRQIFVLLAITLILDSTNNRYMLAYRSIELCKWIHLITVA